MEHPSCSRSEEERHDGDDIRMNAEPVPQQGKDKADGARKPHVEPLLCIVRLE